MKRVLVAGATGYLGGFVAREFKARGYFVRVLARSTKKVNHLRDATDEIVEAEITRPETLEHICDGVDVVFSSIGITRQKDGLTFFQPPPGRAAGVLYHHGHQRCRCTVSWETHSR
jgi:uncharacterized protein YbjT (DUF2867 family)